MSPGRNGYFMGMKVREVIVFPEELTFRVMFVFPGDDYYVFSRLFDRPENALEWAKNVLL